MRALSGARTACADAALASCVVVVLWVLAASVARAAGPLEHTHTREVHAIVAQGARVFVATSGGLVVYDRDGGPPLRKLGAAAGLPATLVRSLAVQDDGRLLVGTEAGAALLELDGALRPAIELVPRAGADRDRFDPVRVVLDARAGAPGAVLYLQSGLRALDGRPIPSGPSGSPAGAMWSAAARGAGSLALGSLDGRLRFVAAGGASTLEVPLPVLALLSVDAGFVVACAEALYLWNGQALRPLLDGGRAVAASALARGPGASALVGAADGSIYRLEDGSLHRVRRLDARVTALAAVGDSIWAGLAGRGLVRFSPGAVPPSSLRPDGEICSNHVTHLTRHRGVLVAGSFDGGACYLRQGRWRPLELASPYVHGVASDGRSLWVAHSNGIARFDEALRPRPIGKSDPPALIEAADRAATYAATAGDGVLLASPSGVLVVTPRPGDRHRVRHFGRRQGIPADLTAAAYLDGTLYAASESTGVVILRNGRPPLRLRDPEQLPEAWVTALLPTGEGLWAGTCQRGVAHVGRARVDMFAGDAGLPGARIIALAAHPRGALIGTLSGLGIVSGSTARPLPLRLPDRRVSALLVESDTTWAATQSGLTRVSPQAMHAALAASAERPATPTPDPARPDREQ